MSAKLSRRDLLKGISGLAGSALLSACGPKATPTTAAKEEPTAAPAKEEQEPTVAPTQAPQQATERIKLAFQQGEAVPGSVGTRTNDKAMMERFGIDIEWIGLGYGQVSEKLNLQAAADEVPDISVCLMNINNDFRDAAFLKLNDLVEQHAPDYRAYMDKEPQSKSKWRIYASDGGLYAIYVYLQGPWWGWVYRKDLAEKLGFEGNLKTVDDYYNFVKAAQAEDPNILGASIIGGSLHTLAWNFRGQFGSHGTANTNWDWWTMEDGKWVDHRLSPMAKEAVDYTRKWWVDGVVDPAMETNTGWEKQPNEWKQGKLILGPNEYQGYSDYDAGIPGMSIVATTPPDGPTGEKGMLGNNCGWNSWTYVIGRHCKYPVEAVKMLQDYYTCDGWIFRTIGVEGQDWTRRDDGKYVFTQQVLDKFVQEQKESGIDGLSVFRKHFGYETAWVEICDPETTANVNYAYVGNMNTEESLTNYDLLMPWVLDQDQYWLPPLTPEEEEELRNINMDLGTYHSETWQGFLTGKIPMSDWDKYVKEMESMGAHRVEEIWNTAQERHNASM